MQRRSLAILPVILATAQARFRVRAGLGAAV